jgi:sigma-B regulation protein RsbU (phosphoserine phosphatase)
VIVVYTDGVTEARDQMSGLYGDDRLTEFLAGGRPSAAALVDELLDEVMQFQSQRPRDDIALVALAVPTTPGQELLGGSGGDGESYESLKGA